jgi:hypothetical protein
MSQVDKAFSSLSELKIWYNDRSGKPLTLADMPEIIPTRWNYFRDNWEFVVEDLKKKVATYSYPDLLTAQIDSLSQLIRIQRHEANRKVNPFSKKTILTDYYSVWESINVASIPMTKEEETVTANKLNKVRRFIKTDFERIRADLANGRDEISDTVGLSDSDYNLTFDRSSVAQLRSARIKDVTDMQTLQKAIITVDYILANTAGLSTTNVDPFALARANANNPDIEIRTALSGQLVRMHFGDSLQDLASRYLGNADRWIEIAIANGLRPPYIDEIGQAVPLISNGSGSQINIAGLDVDGKPNRDKVYINQVVFLQSNVVKFPDQRTILSIKEVPISGELVIELSGEANLGLYQTVDNAHVRVFKPNTINSNFMVMLPSENPVSNQSTKEVPFFLASKSEDEKRAGVDLLLTADNDLSFTASGDLQLSYGLSNAMQAIQLKMVSEKGQNPRHPSFGLPAILGARATDPTVIKNALVTGINDMVNADSRFSRVETIDVTVRQGSAIISLVVRLAGSGSLLPLNFAVNIG